MKLPAKPTSESEPRQSVAVCDRPRAADAGECSFVDMRASTATQRKLDDLIVGSPRAVAHQALITQIDQSPRVTAQRQQAEAMSNSPTSSGLEDDISETVAGVTQRQDSGSFLDHSPSLQANHTGLPDGLKAGIEALSGMDMSTVRVHGNSAKPAQLNALAYAQGDDIHVGPGQERHLPHEAWHVVQQRQGRVRPTLQAKGVSINDDAGLEREADVMGVKALAGAHGLVQRTTPQSAGTGNRSGAPVQRLAFYHGGGKAFVDLAIAGIHTAKASEGELGSKGMYYWKDDENSALTSAVVYNPSADWAVMKIDINSEVFKAQKATTKILNFPTDSVAPTKMVGGGKPVRVLGMHYRFLQNNLAIKLGKAETDNDLLAENKRDQSIEGKLAEEYKDLTGREFLDSFDLVISPTKAENYKYADLRQARANDTGLTNMIYGEGATGEKNTFTKTWRGKITDVGHQSTIANMGLAKKDEVPEALTEMNGKKGTTATSA
jgi:hypothetical protein